MEKTFEHSAQGVLIHYELQQDGATVKRTALRTADGTEGGLAVNRSVSSWKWGKDGWTGSGSRSAAGHAVATAFGFIGETQ